MWFEWIFKFNYIPTRAHDLKINIQFSRGNWRMYLFIYRAAPIWNDLDASIVNCITLQKFKCKLDKCNLKRYCRGGGVGLFNLIEDFARPRGVPIIQNIQISLLWILLAHIRFFCIWMFKLVSSFVKKFHMCILWNKRFEFWYSLVKCNIDVLLGSMTFWRRWFRHRCFGADVLGPTFSRWDVLLP